MLRLVYSRRSQKVSFSLEIVYERGCGVPKTLVERAAEKAATLLRELKRRGKADLAARDEVWVVFDRDDHPNVEAALCQARDNGIGVVYSGPCFELWPQLNVQDQTAEVDRRALQRLLQQVHAGYDHDRGANVRWELLEPSARAAAVGRAIHDHRRASERGDPLSNPSTTAWILDQRVQEAADKDAKWFFEVIRRYPELAMLLSLLPGTFRSCPPQGCDAGRADGLHAACCSIAAAELSFKRRPLCRGSSQRT